MLRCNALTLAAAPNPAPVFPGHSMAFAPNPIAIAVRKSSPLVRYRGCKGTGWNCKDSHWCVSSSPGFFPRCFLADFKVPPSLCPAAAQNLDCVPGYAFANKQVPSSIASLTQKMFLLFSTLSRSRTSRVAVSSSRVGSGASLPAFERIKWLTYLALLLQSPCTWERTLSDALLWMVCLLPIDCPSFDSTADCDRFQVPRVWFEEPRSSTLATQS